MKIYKVNERIDDNVDGYSTLKKISRLLETAAANCLSANPKRDVQVIEAINKSIEELEDLKIKIEAVKYNL